MLMKMTSALILTAMSVPALAAEPMHQISCYRYRAKIEASVHMANFEGTEASIKTSGYSGKIGPVYANSEVTHVVRPNNGVIFFVAKRSGNESTYATLFAIPNTVQYNEKSESGTFKAIIDMAVIERNKEMYGGTIGGMTVDCTIQGTR